MQKVWITKYALTKGLYEMEVVKTSEDGDSVYGKAWYDAFHGEGKDWCRTREEAVQLAEEMRSRKINNLKKKISELEKKIF